MNALSQPLAPSQAPKPRSAGTRLRGVVHIGAPKTGTTWLQKVLTDNRALLQTRGVLYPDASLRGFGHHDLAFLLGGGYPEWATPQPRNLADIEAELKQTVTAHRGTVLLSSENFYLYPEPATLRGLLERCWLVEPAIVVYLRRQDAAHESWFNQTIKAQGYTHTLEECIARFHGLWDFEAQLAKWADAFGRDALVVRVYEEQQFEGGSLLTDFAAAAGIDARGLVLPEAEVNAGLNRDILEFQRVVNGLPLATIEKRRFHKELIALSAGAKGSGLFDESPLLTPARRQDLMAQYAAGNRAVARTYLGRDELFREPLPQDGAAPGEGLTTEKLARILGWLLAKGKADG